MNLIDVLKFKLLNLKFLETCDIFFKYRHDMFFVGPHIDSSKW